jgi:hypothetical protein
MQRNTMKNLIVKSKEEKEELRSLLRIIVQKQNVLIPEVYREMTEYLDKRLMDIALREDTEYNFCIYWQQHIQKK